MRILIYTKGPIQVPSARFRGHLLAAELRRQGHDVRVEALPEDTPKLFSSAGLRDFVQYIHSLSGLAPSDVLYLQRAIYNKFFFTAVILVRIFKRRKFVFDIDDAVYVHSPYKTKLIVSLASLVTCGGEEIQTWVRRYNSSTLLFYNALPSEYFSERIDNEDVVIGWIGNGRAHRENLALLRDPLQRLADAGNAFTFRLIGAVCDQGIHALFRDLPGVKVEIIDDLDWTQSAAVIRELDRFTIGVMPLTDTVWNRAKYMKTLEYMARGVVPVVSGVGENKRIVRSGENGLLVHTQEGWYPALERLLRDEVLRKRLSREAANDARTRYSMARRATELTKAIEDSYV